MFYPSTCVGLRYGLMKHMFSGFSWESDYHRYRLAGGSPYCRASARRVDLPAPRLPLRFNALFRQCAGVSRLRRHVTVT